jgi:serine/threonine protein kinase
LIDNRHFTRRGDREMGATAAVHPTDQTLQSYGLGKLDDVSSQSVSKHLEGCESCQRRVADLSSDSFLGRLRGVQGRPDPSGPVVSSLAGLSMLDAGSSSPGPPATSTLPPGLAEHSDYEVVRELGHGGMGTVYLALNRLMGRHEVLKVVNSHLVKRSGVLDRFLGEIRNAARLHHTNIVTAYSAVRIGESIVFAMEYVEGLDLAKLVKAKGRLPVANACNYTHQAALGLQHAHELGMVHRDIKPSNLMLAKQGNRAVIKVLDFGLAKIKSEGAVDGGLTHEGQMLGTPDYISPEQIRDARGADIRADIYSLGCTLYSLLTGGPPFQATSLYEILQAHHSMDALPLNLARPEVPVELAVVVSKMMAKEPERRFQEPKEVAQALNPFFKAGGIRRAGSKPDVSQAGNHGIEGHTAGSVSMPTNSAKSHTTAPAATPGKLARATKPGQMWESLIEIGETVPPAYVSEPKRGLPPWIWASVAAGVLLIGLVVAWAAGILRVKTANGVIVLENVPENAAVEVDGDRITITPASGVPIKIERQAGKHIVMVKRGGDVLLGESVTLESGKRSTLTVRLEPRDASISEKGDGNLAEATKPAPPVSSGGSLDRKVEYGRFERLFNGTDLAGWEIAVTNGGEWAVVGGMLEGKGNGKAAVIVTQRQDLANFHLRVKFREDDHRAAGGGNIEIRRSPVGDNRNGYLVCRGVWPAIGTEQTPVGSITKMSNHPYWHGIAWQMRAEPISVAVNVWNTLDITAIGNRITTSVNGRRVAEYLDASGWYGAGGIGFVVWGNSVLQFQDIMIQELPDSPTYSEEKDVEASPATAATHEDRKTPETAGGFGADTEKKPLVQLFNGKDLTGWKNLFPQNGSEWTVRDGVLEGRGGGVFGSGAVLLSNRQDFANYRLRIRTRYPQTRGGIVEVRISLTNELRSSYGVDHGAWPTTQAYQRVPGSISKVKDVKFGTRGNFMRVTVDPFPVSANEWHDLAIEAVRDRITVSLDGKKISEYADSDEPYSSGGIALGCFFDSVVQFQEIVIEELADGDSEEAPARNQTGNNK